MDPLCLGFSELGVLFGNSRGVLGGQWGREKENLINISQPALLQIPLAGIRRGGRGGERTRIDLWGKRRNKKQKRLKPHSPMNE